MNLDIADFTSCHIIMPQFLPSLFQHTLIKQTIHWIMMYILVQKLTSTILLAYPCRHSCCLSSTKRVGVGSVGLVGWEIIVGVRWQPREAAMVQDVVVGRG